MAAPVTKIEIVRNFELAFWAFHLRPLVMRQIRFVWNNNVKERLYFYITNANLCQFWAFGGDTDYLPVSGQKANFKCHYMLWSVEILGGWWLHTNQHIYLINRSRGDVLRSSLLRWHCPDRWFVGVIQEICVQFPSVITKWKSTNHWRAATTRCSGRPIFFQDGH